MALWGKSDNDQSKPKYLNDDDKDLTIGVDVAEATDADSVSKGLTIPGWVKYVTYDDSQGNTRRKSEILVAMRSFGTDGDVTLNDDLGIVTTNLDYPTPRSGNWRTGSVALNGLTYSAGSSTAEPTGGLAFGSILTPTAGLYRSKYNGNFTNGAQDTVGAYDLAFFENLTPLKSIVDPYVGWGFQIDGGNLGESLFSVEWQGYVKVPAAATQNYRILVESDDTCAVWIGSEAVSGFSSSNHIVSSANKSLPGQSASTISAKSLTLDPNKYYPIRIWYSEFTGGCKFQMYALGQDGTKLNSEDMDFYHNGTTNGYNP